jgi:tRNA uridine 5-carboxymethylaminomethyl modification enzyme
LTEIGRNIGLASDYAHQRLLLKKQSIDKLMRFLAERLISPTEEVNSCLSLFESTPLHDSVTLARFLRRPEISMEQIHVLVPDMPVYSRDIEAQAEIQIKYEGYVSRQTEMAARFRKIENLKLPDDFDYTQISGLSREVREKLSRIRPRSLGQASRIAGITPAAISLLSIHLKKRSA